MEFTMRTVIVMVLLLAGALMFTMMITGWSGDANNFFKSVTDSFGNMVLGKG